MGGHDQSDLLFAVLPACLRRKNYTRRFAKHFCLLIFARYNTIQYGTVYLRSLKSWRNGQL